MLLCLIIGGGKVKKLVLFLAVVGLIGMGTGIAKETTKKVSNVSTSKTGIGFNSQLSYRSISSLSIRHWVSSNTGIEGLLGFSLGDDTIFDVGAKFLMSLKKEQNLTVYSYGLAGIESFDVNGQNDTSLTIGAGFGIEFFLNGLSNLGFGTEFGLGFSDANGKNQFGTSAGWLSSVGIRYY